MRDRYIRIIESINRFIKYFMAASLAVMSVVIGLQVFFRFIQSALPWSEELMRYLMVYIVFLGASVAYYEGSHMVVEVFEKILPGPVKKIHFVCLHVAICVFFLVIAYYGMQMILISRTQLSPALQIPIRLVYVAIPLGCILMVLNGIALLKKGYIFTNERQSS